MAKLNFQQLFQYSVSHDPSEIILWNIQETFPIIINVRNSLLLNMLWKPWSGFFFSFLEFFDE